MPLTDSADLVLFYAPRSRAATGLWFMEELGRPYRIELLDLNKGEHKTERLMPYNPMGKVPTVLDGGVPISETGAIITYLVDKYAPGKLGPRPDEPERAAYLKWLFFGGNVIEPALGEKFFKWDVPARSVAWGSFADMLRTVTDAIEGGGWLAGERFSGADLYISALLRYAILFGALPKEGSVADYVARCRDRPAVARADAIEARYAPAAG